MSNNLKRHKLLKLLAQKYINASQGKEQGLGVSWEELTSKLNWTMDELLEVSSPLFAEEEVGKHDAYGIKGIYAKMKGVSAYSSRKYRREHERIVFDRLKNWIQTVIPILSLLITVIVVLLSEQRLQNTNLEIEILTKRLDSLENTTQRFLKTPIDTLK